MSVKCHFYSIAPIYQLRFSVAYVFFPRRHLFEGKTCWEKFVGLFIWQRRDDHNFLTRLKKKKIQINFTLFFLLCGQKKKRYKLGTLTYSKERKAVSYLPVHRCGHFLCCRQLQRVYDTENLIEIAPCSGWIENGQLQPLIWANDKHLKYNKYGKCR